MKRERVSIINSDAPLGITLRCCGEDMRDIGTWPRMHEDCKKVIRTRVFECQRCFKEIQIAGVEDKDTSNEDEWNARMEDHRIVREAGNYGYYNGDGGVIGP